MEISEVRIKLVDESRERLRAFCSITLDGDFVIRDLKIIDGLTGPFVAMPSRKLADRCPRCGCKNHLRARFCNDCGLKLNENRAPKDPMGRAKLHADVAHPINAGCRERIQTAVIKAYEAEVERSKSPDYRPPVYDDFGDDDVSHLVEEEPRRASRPASGAAAPAGAHGQEAGLGEGEPSASTGSAEAESAFSDYNSLIADLKKEAAVRNTRGEGAYTPPPRPSEPRSDRGDRGDRRDRGGREGGRPFQGGPRAGSGERSERGGHREDRGLRRSDEPRPGREERPVRRDQPPPPAADHREEPAAAPPPAPPAADETEQDDFAAGL